MAQTEAILAGQKSAQLDVHENVEAPVLVGTEHFGHAHRAITRQRTSLCSTLPL